MLASLLAGAAPLRGRVRSLQTQTQRAPPPARTLPPRALFSAMGSTTPRSKTLRGALPLGRGSPTPTGGEIDVSRLPALGGGNVCPPPPASGLWKHSSRNRARCPLEGLKAASTPGTPRVALPPEESPDRKSSGGLCPLQETTDAGTGGGSAPEGLSEFSNLWPRAMLASMGLRAPGGGLCPPSRHGAKCRDPDCSTDQSERREGRRGELERESDETSFEPRHRDLKMPRQPYHYVERERERERERETCLHPSSQVPRPFGGACGRSAGTHGRTLQPLPRGHVGRHGTEAVIVLRHGMAARTVYLFLHIYTYMCLCIFLYEYEHLNNVTFK